MSNTEPMSFDPTPEPTVMNPTDVDYVGEEPEADEREIDSRDADVIE